jgi:hypothetical protein
MATHLPRYGLAIYTDYLKTHNYILYYIMIRKYLKYNLLCFKSILYYKIDYKHTI